MFNFPKFLKEKRRETDRTVVILHEINSNLNTLGVVVSLCLKKACARTRDGTFFTVTRGILRYRSRSKTDLCLLHVADVGLPGAYTSVVNCE